MIHVRRSIAALLCVMFCLSFVGVGTAMADDSSTPEPTENQETVPAANEGDVAPEEPAAPAGEAAPVEQPDTAEAEVTENEADPTQGEEVQAPDTTEPQTDAPEEETEPQGGEQPAPEANVMSVAEDEPEADAVDGEVQATELEVKEAEEKSVILNAGGGRFEDGKKTKDVKLVDGKLPTLDEPTRDGWKFEGWYDKEPLEYLVSAPGQRPVDKGHFNGTKYVEGQKPPAGSVLYAYYKFTGNFAPVPRTVTFNAGEGYLKDPIYETDGAAKTRTVTLEDDKLPSVLPTPKTDMMGEGWTFKGWYDKEPTYKYAQQPDGKSYVFSVTANGNQHHAEEKLDPGIDTLYAYYEFTEKTETIIYKLNWNGWQGKNTSLRLYRPKGSTFENGAVYGMNFDDASFLAYLGRREPGAKVTDGDMTPDNLKGYWASHSFGGYYFKGWYTKPNDGVKMTTKDSVENGATYYAHWEYKPDPEGEPEKDQTSNTPPVAPKPESIGFHGFELAGLNAHAGGSQAVTVVTGPSGSTAENITWTVEIEAYDAELAAHELLRPSNKKTDTLTVTGEGSETGNNTGVTVTAKGETLTVTSSDNYNTVVLVNASITVDGKVISTNAPAQITFSHSWVEKSSTPAQCTVDGSVTYECSHPDCQAVRTETVPMTGHTYVNPHETENGWSVSCKTCKAEQTVEIHKVATISRVGVTAEELAKQYGGDAEDMTVIVKDAAGNTVTGSQPLGTGWTVLICDRFGHKLPISVPMVVTGDTNGDGCVDTADVNDVLQSIVAPGTLTGVYEQAAHVTGGGSVTTNDAVAMLDMAG